MLACLVGLSDFPPSSFFSIAARASRSKNRLHLVVVPVLLPLVLVLIAVVSVLLPLVVVRVLLPLVLVLVVVVAVRVVLPLVLVLLVYVGDCLSSNNRSFYSSKIFFDELVRKLCVFFWVLVLASLSSEMKETRREMLRKQQQMTGRVSQRERERERERAWNKKKNGMSPRKERGEKKEQQSLSKIKLGQKKNKTIYFETPSVDFFSFFNTMIIFLSLSLPPSEIMAPLFFPLFPQEK